MNEDQFWNLIESSKPASENGLDQQVEWLQQQLQMRSGQEILDFDRLLHEQMRKSYSWDLWAAAYIINGGCSDDGFDYFRAWLIAQGKEIFQKALQDPETLTDVADTDASLEELLYVADKAYEGKTNTRFPRFNRPRAELTGEEWEEDETVLRNKYPKLFARFSASNRERGLRPVAALLRESMAQGRAEISEAEANYRQAVLEMMDEKPASLAQAVAHLTQAADNGHAGAQYLLGTCLQRGRGVRQSFPQAAQRYRQAAENGNAPACAALALLYHKGLEIDQDYDEAFKWYSIGAELGSSDSEFGLGVLYAGGLGIEKNLPESLKQFRRAAQDGHERAALNVGLCYLHGKGVEANAEEAFKWFLRAAEFGSVAARFNLGVLYAKGKGVTQDIPKAIEMYQMAAEKDHAGAMLNLGMLYSAGNALTQDYVKAAEWYRRAMDAGDVTALSNLAVLYRHGHGVPQDHAEAVRLFRKSAEAGVAVGQFNLGTMYHRGLGVAKDDQEALRWYRLAAAQNQASAMNNIGDAYENGYGVAQDYAEAAKWYRQAAERGVAPAQCSLGKFYFEGLGVARDHGEAEKWFRAAIEKGYEKAKPLLEALYASGHVEGPQAAVEQKEPSSLALSAKPDSNSGQKIVSPQIAAQRALCLRALVRRTEIEAQILSIQQSPEATQPSRLRELQAEARQINVWLKDEELWLAVSNKEKKLLNFSPGSWSQKLLKHISWRAEALGVLVWALGLEANVLPYDSKLDTSSFVHRWQILLSTKQFIASANLRDEKEILQAREIAENWLWRARTTQIQKEPEKYPPPDGWTYERIITAAAEHWEKQGLFKAIRGDYPACGKAYCELTDQEWQELRSLATERLCGLNWLCKFSANWDLVPTGT